MLGPTTTTHRPSPPPLPRDLGCILAATTDVTLATTSRDSPSFCQHVSTDRPKRTAYGPRLTIAFSGCHFPITDTTAALDLTQATYSITERALRHHYAHRTISFPPISWCSKYNSMYCTERSCLIIAKSLFLHWRKMHSLNFSDGGPMPRIVLMV
jgi:hypothetical protein